VIYTTTTDKKKGEAYLDQNHTHFILVDTAQLKTYSGEIRFRGEFEKRLTNFSQNADEKIPLVLLVVGGGPNTYKTCVAAIKAGSPCVFIDVSKKLIIGQEFLIF
jgi:hypothetical protein